MHRVPGEQSPASTASKVWEESRESPISEDSINVQYEHDQNEKSGDIPNPSRSVQRSGSYEIENKVDEAGSTYSTFLEAVRLIESGTVDHSDERSDAPAFRQEFPERSCSTTPIRKWLHDQSPDSLDNQKSFDINEFSMGAHKTSFKNQSDTHTRPGNDTLHHEISKCAPSLITFDNSTTESKRHFKDGRRSNCFPVFSSVPNLASNSISERNRNFEISVSKEKDTPSSQADHRELYMTKEQPSLSEIESFVKTIHQPTRTQLFSVKDMKLSVVDEDLKMDLVETANISAQVLDAATETTHSSVYPSIFGNFKQQDHSDICENDRAMLNIESQPTNLMSECPYDCGKNSGKEACSVGAFSIVIVDQEHASVKTEKDHKHSSYRSMEKKSERQGLRGGTELLHVDQEVLDLRCNLRTAMGKDTTLISTEDHELENEERKSVSVAAAHLCSRKKLFDVPACREANSKATMRDGVCVMLQQCSDKFVGESRPGRIKASDSDTNQQPCSACGFDKRILSHRLKVLQSKFDVQKETSRKLARQCKVLRDEHAKEIQELMKPLAAVVVVEKQELNRISANRNELKLECTSKKGGLAGCNFETLCGECTRLRQKISSLQAQISKDSIQAMKERECIRLRDAVNMLQTKLSNATAKSMAIEKRFQLFKAEVERSPRTQKICDMQDKSTLCDLLRFHDLQSEEGFLHQQASLQAAVSQGVHLCNLEFEGKIEKMKSENLQLRERIMYFEQKCAEANREASDSADNILLKQDTQEVKSEMEAKLAEVTAENLKLREISEEIFFEDSKQEASNIAENASNAPSIIDALIKCKAIIANKESEIVTLKKKLDDAEKQNRMLFHDLQETVRSHQLIQSSFKMIRERESNALKKLKEMEQQMASKIKDFDLVSKENILLRSRIESLHTQYDELECALQNLHKRHIQLSDKQSYLDSQDQHKKGDFKPALFSASNACNAAVSEVVANSMRGNHESSHELKVLAVAVRSEPDNKNLEEFNKLHDLLQQESAKAIQCATESAALSSQLADLKFIQAQSISRHREDILSIKRRHASQLEYINQVLINSIGVLFTSICGIENLLTTKIRINVERKLRQVKSYEKQINQALINTIGVLSTSISGIENLLSTKIRINLESKLRQVQSYEKQIMVQLSLREETNSEIEKKKAWVEAVQLELDECSRQLSESRDTNILLDKELKFAYENIQNLEATVQELEYNSKRCEIQRSKLEEFVLELSSTISELSIALTASEAKLHIESQKASSIKTFLASESNARLEAEKIAKKALLHFEHAMNNSDEQSVPEETYLQQIETKLTLSGSKESGDTSEKRKYDTKRLMNPDSASAGTTKMNPSNEMNQFSNQYYNDKYFLCCTECNSLRKQIVEQGEELASTQTERDTLKTHCLKAEQELVRLKITLEKLRRERDANRSELSKFKSDLDIFKTLQKELLLEKERLLRQNLHLHSQIEGQIVREDQLFIGSAQQDHLDQVYSGTVDSQSPNEETKILVGLLQKLLEHRTDEVR